MEKQKWRIGEPKMENRKPDFLHRKKPKFLLFLHLYNYFFFIVFYKYKNNKKT